MNRNTVILVGALIAAGGAAVYAFRNKGTQVPVAAAPPQNPAPQHSQYVPQPVQQMQPQLQAVAQNAQQAGVNLNQIVAGASSFVNNLGGLASGVANLGNTLGSLFGK